MAVIQRIPLPDVAEKSARLTSNISKVGMDGIETFITIKSSRVPAKADVSVNFTNPEKRGIHMSRLYKQLETLSTQELSFDLINQVLNHSLDSQSTTSTNAYLNLQFDITLEKKSLASDNVGYRTYPVTVSSALENGQVKHDINLKVLYSSSCPCSTALSKHHLAEKDPRKIFRLC